MVTITSPPRKLDNREIFAVATGILFGNPVVIMVMVKIPLEYFYCSCCCLSPRKLDGKKKKMKSRDELAVLLLSLGFADDDPNAVWIPFLYDEIR